MNVAFWNVKGRNIDQLAATLAAQRSIDVLALAENGSANVHRTLAELKRSSDPGFMLPASTYSHLQVFSRHPVFDLSEGYADFSGKLTIRRLAWRGEILNFAVVHLPSKLYMSDADQAFNTTEVARAIRDYETKLCNGKTVVVGDFNMNPFELGVVGATGLHSSMAMSVALSGSRKVQGRSYNYFYNPMWSLFGDRSTGPPGTYYYRNSTPISYDWNMFDQVMLRPEIASHLSHVEIVTAIGQIDLKDGQGRPNASVGSDHFPIVFTLLEE